MLGFVTVLTTTPLLGYSIRHYQSSWDCQLMFQLSHVKVLQSVLSKQWLIIVCIFKPIHCHFFVVLWWWNGNINISGCPNTGVKNKRTWLYFNLGCLPDFDGIWRKLLIVVPMCLVWVKMIQIFGLFTKRAFIIFYLAAAIIIFRIWSNKLSFFFNQILLWFKIALNIFFTL